jgi:hypothetical protein
MLKWTADFTNDPNNDFELIVEILCNDQDVAVIKQGNSGLELKLYPHNKDLIIPFDWLIGLMNEVSNRMKGDLSKK